jgi:uncharacterized alpha-E superfamily protein
MLASVANRIYWVGRYLERAENTARLINVYTGLLLDLPKEAGVSWRQMPQIAGCLEAFEQYQQWPLERNAVRFMAAYPDNPSSIIASLRQARENLRTLRDLVPKEAFESANELYLFGNAKLPRAASRRNRFAVLDEVVQRCQQLTGIFAGTMNHSEGYQFLRLGRNLERADMTTRMVDVAGELLEEDREAFTEYETTLWVNVLRCLSAYQAYRQSVRRRIVPVRVLYFVLHDVQFPRSVAHCLAELSASARQLPVSDAVVEAVAGLAAHLQGMSVRGIAREHLHESMDDLQRRLGVAHEAIGKSWFASGTSRTSA